MELTTDDILDLYLDIEPRIYGFVTEHVKKKELIDDYVSVAKIAVMNSINKFDQSKGKPLNEYAFLCAKNSVMSEIRKSFNQQNRFEHGCCSLDTFKNYKEAERIECEEYEETDF